MTVQELLNELSRHHPNTEVTVECESQGDGVFSHSVFAGGDLVVSWDTEE